jgi:hypothetical protein
VKINTPHRPSPSSQDCRASIHSRSGSRNQPRQSTSRRKPTTVQGHQWSRSLSLWPRVDLLDRCRSSVVWFSAIANRPFHRDRGARAKPAADFSSIRPPIDARRQVSTQTGNPGVERTCASDNRGSAIHRLRARTTLKGFQRQIGAGFDYGFLGQLGTEFVHSLLGQIADFARRTLVQRGGFTINQNTAFDRRLCYRAQKRAD